MTCWHSFDSLPPSAPAGRHQEHIFYPYPLAPSSPNRLQLQVTPFLREHWPAKIKNAIRVIFKDVGKGWFNVHETKTVVK